MVLVAQSRGYTPGSLVQTPDEEAKSLERYFLDFYKIQAALLIQESEFTTRGDGVRFALASQFQKDYPFPMMLVGRDGAIQWVGSIQPDEEAMLDAYVKRALTGTTAAKAPATTPAVSRPDTSVGASQ